MVLQGTLVPSLHIQRSQWSGNFGLLIFSAKSLHWLRKLMQKMLHLLVKAISKRHIMNFEPEHPNMVLLKTCQNPILGPYSSIFIHTPYNFRSSVLDFHCKSFFECIRPPAVSARTSCLGGCFPSKEKHSPSTLRVAETTWGPSWTGQWAIHEAILGSCEKKTPDIPSG